MNNIYKYYFIVIILFLILTNNIKNIIEPYENSDISINDIKNKYGKNVNINVDTVNQKIDKTTEQEGLHTFPRYLNRIENWSIRELPNTKTKR